MNEQATLNNLCDSMSNFVKLLLFPATNLWWVVQDKENDIAFKYHKFKFFSYKIK